MRPALVVCSMCALVVGAGAGRAAAGPDASSPWKVTKRRVMHTVFEVHMPRADHVPAACWAKVTAIEAMANEWREDSPLAALNERAGAGWVALPPPLLELLGAARDVAGRSEGAFDPTWAALWGLWDFSSDAPRPPVAETVERHRRLVNWRDLELDPRQRRARLRRRGQKVGLGGIAKGAALDAMAACLRASGVTAFALSAGGQVLLHGERRPNAPWRVGIRDPRGTGPSDPIGSLQLRGGSVSTSGDYERFFVYRGQRYHHLLDPRTGRPARGLRSATVVHPRAQAADAWSTAIFVAGPRRAAALCARLHAEGGGCVLIDAAGGVRISPALRPQSWFRPGVRAAPLSEPPPTPATTRRASRR